MKKIISREVFRNTFILRPDYKKKIKKKVNGVSYEEGERRISETIIRERETERERDLENRKSYMLNSFRACFATTRQITLFSFAM